MWFYTALANILLANLLVSPFFVKPGDVISYSVAAIVALLSVQTWAQWGLLEQAVFTIACGFCAFVLLLAMVTILTKDATSEIWQQWHQTVRLLANSFGNQRVLFTVVVVAAVIIFHRHTSREVVVILIAWVIISSRPESVVSAIFERLQLIWRSGPPVQVAGIIAAYQAPNMVLIRQNAADDIPFGTLLLVRDPHAPSKLTMAMDYVGRDEGVLLRALEVAAPGAALLQCRIASNTIPNNAVATITFTGACGEAIAASEIPDQQARFIGIVAPESSIDRLFFEVVRPLTLREEHSLKHAFKASVWLIRSSTAQQRKT